MNDTTLNIRVSSKEVAEWKKAAAEAGILYSEWVRLVLNTQLEDFGYAPHNLAMWKIRNDGTEPRRADGMANAPGVTQARRAKRKVETSSAEMPTVPDPMAADTSAVSVPVPLQPEAATPLGIDAEVSTLNRCASASSRAQQPEVPSSSRKRYCRHGLAFCPTCLEVANAHD